MFERKQCDELNSWGSRALVSACALILALAIPLGVLAASPRHGVDDRASNLLVFEGVDRIFTVQSDGKGLRAVVDYNGPLPADPSWSPNGRWIVYASSQGGFPNRHTDLYVANANGRGVRRLTSHGVNTQPSWSPPGDLIAFIGSDRIYVVRPGGTGLKALTPRGVKGKPIWSPNGELIAFDWQSHGTYVMAADGRHLRRINNDAI